LHKIGTYIMLRNIYKIIYYNMARKITEYAICLFAYKMSAVKY